MGYIYFTNSMIYRRTSRTYRAFDKLPDRSASSMSTRTRAKAKVDTKVNTNKASNDVNDVEEESGGSESEEEEEEEEEEQQEEQEEEEEPKSKETVRGEGKRQIKKVENYKPPATETKKRTKVPPEGNKPAASAKKSLFPETPREELERYHLANIKGIDRAVDLLRSTYVDPQRYPKAYELYKKVNGWYPNLLLYGPPGTGKTEIVKALANEMNLPLYEVPANRLQSKFVNDAAKKFGDLVRHVIQERKGQGCIIFFDEGEVLFREGNSEEGDATSITSAFKTEVQVSGTYRSPPGVIWMIATNHPGRITENAVLSRIPIKVYVGLPEPKNLVKVGLLLDSIMRINEQRCDAPVVDLNKIITEDQKQDIEYILYCYSGRDIPSITQTIWRFMKSTPLHAKEYKYAVMNSCVGVYQRAQNGSGYDLVSPVDGKFKPKLKDADVMELDTIEALSKQVSFEWSYLDFEALKKALADPIIFPSINETTIQEFYYYAKDVLNDIDGADSMIRWLAKGWQDRRDNPDILTLTSKEFNKKIYSKFLPKFMKLDDEVKQELLRYLGTLDNKKE